MKLSSKSDLVFMSLIVAAFLACVWFLYSEGLNHGSGVHGVLVGTVTYKNHFAERKVSGEVLWNAMSQNTPVYNDDTVHTAAGSSAVIHLLNQTEISLGEQTMVLVNVAREGTRINISGGMVAVRRTGNDGTIGGADAGSTPITMNSGASSVSFTSGSVSVASDTGGSVVSVESGSATLRTGTESRRIGENSVTSMQDLSPVAMPLQAIAPRLGQNIVSTTDNQAVEFSWLGKIDAGLSADYAYLLVASDSGFSHPEYRSALRGTQATVSLPEGTHYWKLVVRGVATSTRWFNVLVQRPPRIIGPADGAVFALDQTIPLVSFLWMPDDGASSYQVEVDRDNGKAVVRTSTSLSSLSVDSIGEGKYRWRIVGIFGSNVYPSQSFGFSVKKIALTLPELTGLSQISDGIGATVSTIALENGAVVASWNDVDGADRYHAVVSRDAAGNSVVASVDTRFNVLRINKDLPAGTYYVRVSASSGNSDSGPSRAIAVRVVNPVPPRAIFPLAGASIDPSDPHIAFRWSDPNLGNKYRVLVSDDPSFSRPIISLVSSVEQVSANLSPVHNGTMMWKVQLLDDSGSLIVSSEPSRFLLPKLFESPRPISPANGEEIDVNAESSIAFNWDAVPGATAYDVNLYRIQGSLRSTVKSWTIGQPGLSFGDFSALSVDSYAWDLSAKATSGDTLLGKSPTVLSYFRIVQSAPLAAPRNVVFGGWARQ